MARARKSTRKPSMRRKKLMRKRTRGKSAKASSKQLITLNRVGPIPQVFKKISLADSSGAVIIGGGAQYWAIGGVTGANMPDWTNILTLYNRYKIKSVSYTFNVQSTGSASLISFDLPKLYIRYNYDSNLSAGLLGVNILAKMQEVPHVKQFQFTPEHTSFTYKFYPKCIEPVYLSSVSTGYKLARPQYIDTQYGTVPHYGIMYYFDFVASGIKITQDIQYEIAFKYEV